MNDFNKETLEKLEKIIGVKFNNQDLLINALVHRSWLNENKSQKYTSNERLEFLGDAVLELWATKNLFEKFPQLPEGSLTNIRAAVVRTESLAQKARNMNLGKYLFLSKGENEGGGRENDSLLADTFEALVGAIFLDQGQKKAEKFLDKNLLSDLKSWGKQGDIKDNKTILQETVQSIQKITPYYQIIKQKGPDHEKQFVVGVYFGDKQIATGEGKSKREAEEEAARHALTIVNKLVKLSSKY